MNRDYSLRKNTIESGRFVIPYRVYENNGPHIICLNGVQQSMAMWHSFIQRFAHKYRTVLFDFPNQGKGYILSGAPRASLDEEVDILDKVIKATRCNGDLTLCSASWGGVVGLAFAAKYPGRVKRLILGSLGTRPNKKMVETIKKGAEIDPDNREEMAQTLLESFGKHLPEAIKHKIFIQFRTMSKENLRSFYEHGLFVLATKEISEVVDLKKIKAKTVLVNGELDSIIDLEDVRFLAKQIPGCEIIIIKNVGHFLHMEREDVLDTYQEIFDKYVPNNYAY